MLLLHLKPITDGFGTYTSGINLSKVTIAVIEAGMDKFSVLVWRDSLLEDDDQIAPAEHFGKIEISPLSKVRGKGGPD